MVAQVFPEASLRRNLSRERIRQGPPCSVRRTAARNMRSTKKSNTFLYRYSTFLRTTLTTIHGTMSHLNDTIKIGFIFLFSFRRRHHLLGRILDLSERGRIYRVSNVEKKKEMRKCPIINLKFLEKFVRRDKKKTNFRTISSSIKLKFFPANSRIKKIVKIDTKRITNLRRKESGGRDPLPLPLPAKAIKFSKYR